MGIMGKVMAKLKLSNEYDEENLRLRTIRRNKVRRVEIEALVDTGATMLVLPADVVAKLGLVASGTRGVKLADGRTKRIPWVKSVRLEVLGRWAVFNALVMPAGTPVLIGQIPLEELDLIVDPKSRDVRVNPASPDVPLLDLLRAG
jgi:clan AA aspartic protease